MLDDLLLLLDLELKLLQSLLRLEVLLDLHVLLLYQLLRLGPWSLLLGCLSWSLLLDRLEVGDVLLLEVVVVQNLLQVEVVLSDAGHQVSHVLTVLLA